MTPANSSISSSDHQPVRATADSGQTRHWKFPVAALAALVLIAGFEAGVWKYRYRIWDANYILLEQKRKAMTQPPAPDTVAIFGMSRFYHIDPAVISELVGGDAQVTNYAWGWCGIEAYEAMLRGLIQADRIPEIILVDGIPEILGYKPELVNARQNEIFQIGMTQTAPQAALLRTQIGLKAWDWTWETMARTMTPPSTLYRDRVVAGLETLVRERHLPPLPAGYDQTVEPWLKQGCFLVASRTSATEEEFISLETQTGPYKVYENKEALHAYGRFVRLAGENDIKVVLLPVPNNPLVFAAYEREGVFVRYNRWLDKMEQKHSNFRAPRPRLLNWPESMGDALHVNEAGAERHMGLILKMLGKLWG